MKNSIENKSCNEVTNFELDIDVNVDTLTELINLQEQYGNYFKVRSGKGRFAYFVNEPELTNSLLIKNHGNFNKGPGFERIKMLLGNGLIVSDGDIWRRARRMIQPTFSRQNIHKLISKMVICASDRAELWEKLVLKDEAINITQQTSDFALELILKSIFGHNYTNLFDESGDNPFSFLSEDSTRDLTVVIKMRNLRKLILHIINTRKESTELDDEYDFMHMYLNATDKDGLKFTDTELIDEIITLIVAGYETSAGTLNWLWLLLSQNIEAAEQLYIESDYLHSNIENIDIEMINNMKFTQSILEETLRLYPPVWLFSRRAVIDTKIGESLIPDKSDIYISPYIMHRTTEYWSQPDLFQPSRFISKRKNKKNNSAFIPFSLGPRRCLGEYFSFLEMKIHIGIMIKKFQIEVSPRYNPQLNLGINLRSKNDIFLKLRKR